MNRRDFLRSAAALTASAALPAPAEAAQLMFPSPACDWGRALNFGADYSSGHDRTATSIIATFPPGRATFDRDAQHRENVRMMHALHRLTTL